MNWFVLIVAGLFEVVWVTALKMSNGFRNPLADVVWNTSRVNVFTRHDMAMP